MKELTEQPLYGTAILKARAIMDFIMASETPPLLIEISRNTTINKSTALKILRTLEYCGYVRCLGSEKRYYLGTVFLRYAQTTLSKFDINLIAKPFLKQLRDQTNETVNLGVQVDKSVVLLAKLESPSNIKLSSEIGEGLELYRTAIGKALLSTFGSDQFNEYLATTELLPSTPETITDKSELIKNINLTKARGYAIENSENQIEVICIGFPIVKDDHAYGAFSISIPKYRAKSADLDRYIKYGKLAQAGISNKL